MAHSDLDDGLKSPGSTKTRISQDTDTTEVQTSLSLPPRSTLKSCIIVLTVTFGMIINIANSTAISIALPTIQREMHLQEAQLQWIVSAYPLSSGCLLLVFGRLADVHGRKKTFLLGSVVLAVFTLSCAFPKDVMTLSILRGIQGIGGAATIPASLGILAHAFPPSRARSLAFATFSAGAPVGAVFGTAVGGVLTEFTERTWRSSFYLLCGLTVLCLLGGFFSIDNDVPSQEADKRVDWLGAFLVTAGLVLIVFVLGQGEIAPQKWATPYIIALLILGVILLSCFLYWQHYLEKVQDDPTAPYSVFTPPPLMRLSIWTRANGRFAAMMAIAFTNWCCFLAWTFWVQLYYQNYMKYTAMQTVIRLLPMFVSGLLCNAFVGLMAAHVPLVWLVALGALATSTACVLFAIIIPSAPYWAFAFPASIISVMGADFVFSAGTIFIAKIALPHEQSVAGALFNTMTQLGTAVGITVTTVVYNAVSANHSPEADRISSYRAAQWTAFAFGIIATTLGVLFFRGIGAVGYRGPKAFSEQGNANPEATNGLQTTPDHNEKSTLNEKNEP
ncbi:major facilitator superfamily domain-containing protein [Crassisporium funariophilum]|nr:major facilitator superfamily domain-containing protein [Crassisporium funariophilum]